MCNSLFLAAPPTLRGPDPTTLAAHREAVIAQDDGAIVVAVADDAAHPLVDCAQSLLCVPLVAAQAPKHRPPPRGALPHTPRPPAGVVQDLLFQLHLQGQSRLTLDTIPGRTPRKGAQVQVTSDASHLGVLYGRKGDASDDDSTPCSIRKVQPLARFAPAT